MSEPKPDQVFGAPDEPIRRQRQTVSHLENIAELISDQTESLNRQNEQLLSALKHFGAYRLGCCGISRTVCNSALVLEVGRRPHPGKSPD